MARDSERTADGKKGRAYQYLWVGARPGGAHK